mgnify:FL=1
MKRNAKFKRSMEAVALILPTVLIYTLVIAYPLLNMTYTSFFTWDGIPTSPYIFVGWENYHKFFTDIIALTSLKNVIIIMLVSVLGVIPIAFFFGDGDFQTLFCQPCCQGGLFFAGHHQQGCHRPDVYLYSLS